MRTHHTQRATVSPRASLPIQPLRKFYQQMVSSLMSKMTFTGLETIEIKQTNGSSVCERLIRINACCSRSDSNTRFGSWRQRIVIRQVFQVLLLVLEYSDIREHAHIMANLSVSSRTLKIS